MFQNIPAYMNPNEGCKVAGFYNVCNVAMLNFRKRHISVRATNGRPYNIECNHLKTADNIGTAMLNPSAAASCCEVGMTVSNTT